jgi:hypothetical protein
MAIVQISRITNRKGLQENLPQLAGAEFGWSIYEHDKGSNCSVF